MSRTSPRILITGANGQLGRLVLEELLKTTPRERIVAMVRNAGTASVLAQYGVDVRVAEYDRPDTLEVAFSGVDRLLLISSSEVGRRVPQHRNVIDAAKRVGLKQIVYTSILHADSTPLYLGEEHRQTEALIHESGIAYTVLRNGWYTENNTAAVPAALEFGAVLGSSANGKISAAARADYAAAAAVVMGGDAHEGRVYELAGDAPYTKEELAAEIAAQSGKPVEYKNLSETDYKAALIRAGLPDAFAGLLADSDIGASKGALYDDTHQLSRLIGRSTTSMKESVSAALESLAQLRSLAT